MCRLRGVRIVGEDWPVMNDWALHAMTSVPMMGVIFSELRGGDVLTGTAAQSSPRQHISSPANRLWFAGLAGQTFSTEYLIHDMLHGVL